MHEDLGLSIAEESRFGVHAGVYPCPLPGASLSSEANDSISWRCQCHLVQQLSSHCRPCPVPHGPPDFLSVQLGIDFCGEVDQWTRHCWYSHLG
jgi:hypothetical protein